MCFEKDWFFWYTRSYAALRAADLDWIVGPEYSLGGKDKQKRDGRGVTTAPGGGRGRNKQKRDSRGVTTDLLDV